MPLWTRPVSPNSLRHFDGQSLTLKDDKIDTDLIKVINVYEAPQTRTPPSSSTNSSSSNAVQIFSVIGMICFLVAILGFVIIMKHKRRQSGDANSDEKWKSFRILPAVLNICKSTYNKKVLCLKMGFSVWLLRFLAKGCNLRFFTDKTIDKPIQKLKRWSYL